MKRVLALVEWSLTLLWERHLRRIASLGRAVVSIVRATPRAIAFYGSLPTAIVTAIRVFRRDGLAGLQARSDVLSELGPARLRQFGLPLTQIASPLTPTAKFPNGNFRRPRVIGTTKKRYPQTPGFSPRFWHFIGDSLEWLREHEHLTGVGRVSTELYFAASACRDHGPIHPCILDRTGQMLTAAAPAEVLRRLKVPRSGSASDPTDAKRSESFDHAAVPPPPRPGDHVFFTGLVWTPTFTRLFADLAAKAIGFSVLLHDLIPLELPGDAENDSAHSFATWLTCVLQTADVVYISNSVVEDQVRRWALLAGVQIGARLTRIEFGHRDFPALHEDILTSPRFRALRRDNFVLSVGTIDIRKNQVHLCETWRRLAATSIASSLPQLVLVGRDDLRLHDRRSVFADLIAEGRILLLEDISDRELSALYRSCAFTAFASTREGYGLPVAESLQHGKLCLASALPAIRAHAGDLPWYFDVHDSVASDALFVKAIVDLDARRAAESSIAAHYRHARWSSTVTQMIEAAVEEASSPLPAVTFGPQRPEIPGATAYDCATALERASRWCTDRQPEVSIIIVNWNSADLTLECIRHIFARTEGHTYEILIVDNGSADRDLLRLHQLGRGLRLVSNGCNRFFGEANNIGAELAQGQYLCLLNNDAFVLDGWLIHLMRAFRRHPKVGAVGPMFLYPDGVVQEAGAEIDPQGYPVRFGRGGLQSQEHIRTEKYADYISAATLLIPTELFMESGGFDLAYEPAYYEDTDLCFKLQFLGKKVLYCPQSKVVHLEGSSANGDREAESRRKALGDINRDKFVSRWGCYLRNRQDSALDALRTTLTPRRSGIVSNPMAPQKKVAVLYTPYPLTPGGGERYLLTWGQALARDHQVFLLTSHPYSNLRLRNMAVELRLDLSGIRFISEASFASMPDPDLMVVMGNDVLPPISPRGRLNFYHCQFPFSRGGGSATPANLHGYSAVVVNSTYTRRHYLTALHQAQLSIPEVRIVYPPVPRIAHRSREKAPIILSVGRFFVGGHSKRQDLLIDAFEELLRRTDQPLTLHLAGSSLPQPAHLDYLSRLRAKAQGLPITFHVNIDYDELADLYGRATGYWHGTGLGQNLAAAPGHAEHFGISIVEAMSAGAIPFAFNAGGPVEIIRPGTCGFLYDSLEDLVAKTHHLFTTTAPETRVSLAAAARSRAADFSVDVFQNSVSALLDEFNTQAAA